MDQVHAKRTALRVIAASWLAVFCLFGFRATFAVITVPMGAEMHWSAADLSGGYAIMMAVYAATAFLSGYILDHWGTRPVYLISAVCGALGCLLTSGVTSLYGYYASYGLLVGMGTGMLWVSSTVSVREWYIGRDYARMWGLAFMGAPAAQVILSQIATRVIAHYGWRAGWKMVGLITLAAMVLAAFLARRNPEDYGLEPFGAIPGEVEERSAWTMREAFSHYAIWSVILTFFAALVGEHLIWTEAVMYFVHNLGMDLNTAVALYSMIGVVGIFSMPGMGRVADWVVEKTGHETQGRKVTLVAGALIGALASLLLFEAGHGLAFALGACALFAVFWAMIPGGVVGYTGAVYGRKTLGEIWGLATLICMGIGPATGSYVGGYLHDLTGSYRAPILFAMGAFLVAALAATTMPLKAVHPSAARSK